MSADDLAWFLSTENAPSLDGRDFMPSSPQRQIVTLPADGVSASSNGAPLPLLRLPDWESAKQYDRTDPVCIHYDIQWKVSQYIGSRKRASGVWKRQIRDIVLAPGDLWEKSLKHDIDELVKKELGENVYRREEANITISIKSSRGQGFTSNYHEKPIEWAEVNSHLEGLSGLFEKGKAITLDIDLAYREIVSDNLPAERTNKKRKATEMQRQQMEATAATYSDIYKKLRCDARNCKSGPHCAVDAQGNHLELIPLYIEQLVERVQKGWQFEGPRDLPPELWQALYRDAATKRVAKRRPSNCSVSGLISSTCSHSHAATAEPGPPSPVMFHGKWDKILLDFDMFLVEQVDGEDWKEALRNATRVARKSFLELSLCHGFQKFAREKLVAGGVAPAIAAAWVANIKRFHKLKKAESV